MRADIDRVTGGSTSFPPAKSDTFVLKCMGMSS